jgi:hypothetical protein
MATKDKYYPADVTALNGITSAPTPPTYNSGNGWGVVPPSWKGVAVEDFDVEVWSDSSNAITAARLIAGTPLPVTLADDDIESIAANALTLTSHAYQTGDGPVQVTTTGALPTGITALTNYWVVSTGANTIKLALSLYDALTNLTIAVSGGSGTNTIADVQTGEETARTRRVHFDSLGYLGEANDGSITLTSVMSYKARAKHSQETVLYALVATFGSAVATYMRLVPRPIVR